MTLTRANDVFLSYHWRDWTQVEALARRLSKEHNLSVFLDRWYLIPGQPWPQALERAIWSCNAAAVCIGAGELGPWQLREMNIAGRQLRHERADHTLQPTALVQEVFLHLVDQRRATWHNRAHFFAIAAQVMRRILVDHARSRDTLKRGGAVTTVTLEIDAADVSVDPVAAEVLAVDEALARLAAHDPDQARVVELRFFGGLSVEETAHVMDRSARTVKRDWRMAKAWLFRELQGRKPNARPR